MGRRAPLSDQPESLRRLTKGRQPGERRFTDTRAPAEAVTRLFESKPDSITMHAIEDKELSRLIDSASPAAQNRANLALGAAFGSAPSAINAAVALAHGSVPATTDVLGAGLGLLLLGIGISANLEARRAAKTLRADIEEIRQRPLQEVRRSRSSAG